MKTTKLILSQLTLITTLFTLNACGGSSGSGGVSGGNDIIPTKSSAVYIDVAAQIPLPNGSGISTGVYIHNDTNDNISGLKYSVVDNSSANKSSALKMLSSLVLNTLGLSNSTYTTSSGFSINVNSATVCGMIPAHGSCLLQFNVPSVKAGDKGSAVIKMQNSDGMSQQVINWYDYGDPTKIPAGVHFSNASPDVLQGKYLTAYLIGSGKAGTILKDVQFKMEPSNVLLVSQGISPVTEIASGQVIPVELKPTQNSSSALRLKITPSTFGVMGMPLTFGIIPTDNQNLLVGNIQILPTSMPEADAIDVYLFNNGTQDITNLIKTMPTGVIVAANDTCGSSLPKNSSCSYKIYTNSNTNINDNITYTYSNNSGVVTVHQQVIAFNTSKPNLPSAVITPSIANLDMSFGESQLIYYTITNTSTNMSESFNNVFAAIASGNSTVSVESDTCTNTILPSLGSCVVITKLTAPSESTVGGVYVEADMSYLGINYAFKGGTTYSVTGTGALLVLTGSPVNLSIPGNGVATQTKDIVASNKGDAPLTLSSVAFSKTDSRLTLGGTCAKNVILYKDESCTTTVTLNAESATIAESGINDVVYQYNNGGAVANINWQILPMDTQLAITNVVVTDMSGNGTSLDPYTGTGASANTSTMTITYKNLSPTTKITNFAIDTSSISPFWNVDNASTTCGYGANVQSLESQATCTLSLSVNRQYVTAMMGNITLGFNYPNASWNSSNGLVVQTGMDYDSNTVVFADYQNAVLTSTLSNNNAKFTSTVLTQTLSNAYSSNTQIVTSAIASGIVPTVDAGGCVANSDGSVTADYTDTMNSCTLTYNLPAWAVGPIIVPITFTIVSGPLPSYQYGVSLNPSYLLFSLTAD